MAERLHAHLRDRRMTDRELGQRLRHRQRAAGTRRRPARSRFAGVARARRSSGRSPLPKIDPADARRELARRYLHVFGPATADRFARWAGVSRRSAADTFASLEGSLLPVRSPLGDEWLLAEDEPAIRAAETGCRSRAPAAERRCLLPAPPGSRARAAGSARGPAAASVDVPRVAWRAPRRRRDPRNLAAGAAHRPGRCRGRAFRRQARDAVEAEARALPLPLSTGRSRWSGRAGA